MKFTNINYRLALRYMEKVAKSQDEVNEWGFGKLCPKRAKKQGSRPGRTGDKDEDEK